MPSNFLQLKVEDTILKFNKMHEELDVMPSSTSYEKLVKYSCDSNEVFFMLTAFFFSGTLPNGYSFRAIGGHCA